MFVFKPLCANQLRSMILALGLHYTTSGWVPKVYPITTANASSYRDSDSGEVASDCNIDSDCYELGPNLTLAMFRYSMMRPVDRRWT